MEISVKTFIFLIIFCLSLPNFILSKKIKLKEYQVKFDVAQLDPIHGINGTFIVTVHPSWAPRAALRFKELIESGYYVNNRFFRVVVAYIAEFGFNGDPEITAYWQNKTITDDPVKKQNKRNLISFTCDGPNSRSTAVYINYSHNKNLDEMGCVPFGEVIEGMATVDSVYPVGSHGVGDGSDTFGPNRKMTIEGGNGYLLSTFPQLSYISNAQIITEVDVNNEL